KPTITIDLPVDIISTTLTQTPITTISVTISDPSHPSYISVGLDNSSVQITINGVPYSMTNISSVFTYDWDTSSVEDELYFISITALDFAGNLQNYSFYSAFDIVVPLVIISVTNVTSNGDVFATIDSNGDIKISGSLSDLSSVTGRNSGIDNSTIIMTIQPPGGPATAILDLSFITADQASFYYNWNVFDNITEERVIQFTGVEWELIVSIYDHAGNMNETTLHLKLEQDSPLLQVKAHPPSLIDEGSFTFSVNAMEVLDGTGVNLQSVRFSIYSTDDSLISAYTYDSSEVVVDGIDIILTLNVNMFENGEYYITAFILDNMGNNDVTDSDDFGIRHITTTIPPTTPPTSTPVQSPLNPLDLVQFLLLDVIALVGGIGIAVLFEKVIARRKG
ncbi:MAG: hypothetical protein ACTSR4_05210, partial [Candidatus Hodarchaeales archaeon]